MKTVDFKQFEKMVCLEGYSIGHTRKHHAILDDKGHIVTRFPVNHGKGQKLFVLAIYVKRVMRAISEDKARKANEYE